MGKARSTYTIGELLTDAKNLPLADIPFGYLLLSTLPREIRVYPTDPASLLYTKLKDHPKHKHHLETLIEELIEIDDGKTKRRVFRVIAWVMIFGTIALLATIIYLSLLRREFPSWDQMMWCLGPSAWVVVDKFGALTKDKFKQMGEAIRTFKSRRNGNESDMRSGYYQENNYDPYESRQDIRDDPFSQDEDNNNRR